MNYNVDYFIQKFKEIPEYKWLVGLQKSKFGHCALGHCKNNDEEYGDSYPGNSEEAKSLESIFYNGGIRSVTMKPENRNGWNIADVNNGDNPDYRQESPKQRILAALYDIKKMQQPEPAKERIVYVGVPTTITDQVNELILS